MITEQLLLSNRYRIEEFIGQGGMARVYRGTDQVLGRTVAIKVLSEQLAGDPSFVHRFRREAQAAARLSHPGIVSVFDTGSDDGIHFIVMELIQGRTLEAIGRSERFAPDRAVEIAHAVCSALSAAHERGLVHRDVKPANIMLAPDGTVKVMDFGIARATTSNTVTQTAMVVGTATYLSPEQAEGSPVDARSDLYSLGVVLFEMLTGQPPFIADSPVALAYKHVREDPPRPSVLNPAVGPALEAVVLRAMAKDPASRFQSAQQLRRDLLLVQQGGTGVLSARPRPGTDPTGPITTRSTAELPLLAPRATRRRRRWPAVLVAAAVAMALALAIALVSSGLLTEPRPSSSPGSPPVTLSPEQASPSPPSPTTPPAAQEPLTLGEAILALEAVLEDALSGGDISERAAGKIVQDVNRALDRARRGDVGAAQSRIDEVRDGLGGQVDAGEIASSETADRIDSALADLAAALDALPSGGEGDDGGVEED